MKKLLFVCVATVLLCGPVAAGAGGTPHHHHPQPPSGTAQGGPVKASGDDGLELAYDERTGQLTLYLVEHAVAAEPVTVRVEPTDPHGFGEPFMLELFPIPLKQDPPGLASRFVGGSPELIGLERFLATPLRTEGRVDETTLSVERAAASSRFVCPMDCEGKAYPRAGSCPLCGMSLQPAESAHGDHSPKHGGVLFMAPNGWHHLEGVLSPEGEFRLYLYNDFTRPISAAPFADGAWIEIAHPVDAAVQDIRLPLSVAGDGEFLRTSIDRLPQAPQALVLYLQFEGRDEPDRFDFRFD